MSKYEYLSEQYTEDWVEPDAPNASHFVKAEEVFGDAMNSFGTGVNRASEAFSAVFDRLDPPQKPSVEQYPESEDK